MEGKSLAPYGDTLSYSRERLENNPHGEDSPERIMMRLWERENVPRWYLNYGFTPLEAIVQGVIPERRIPVEERDRQVVAATIQWLATNSGQAFLHEFELKCRNNR